jgi:hypothetical protein
MRNRETGNRDQDLARRAGDQQQAGDEQQVVDADPDVLDAEPRVLPGDGEPALGPGSRNRLPGSSVAHSAGIRIDGSAAKGTVAGTFQCTVNLPCSVSMISTKLGRESCACADRAASRNAKNTGRCRCTA